MSDSATTESVPHAQPSADRASERSTGRRRALAWAEAYAFVGVGVAVAIFFSLWPNTSDIFLHPANLRTILGNQSVLAIVAIAALVPLVCNEWDLSVGATAGLSAVFVASAMSDGTAVPVAIMIGVGLGAVVGTVNGLIVTRIGVNGVITTLGMATILFGVVTQKTGGLAEVSNIPNSVTEFGSGTTLGVPRSAFVMVAVALGAYYLLAHTPYGRQLYAYGSNTGAAALAGLRTKLLVGTTFVIAGGLAGAAGALQVARAGGADPDLGENFTLPALAAAFLSAASITPGRYNVGGTLVAIFVLAVINNGLTLGGAPPYVTSYVNGAALIIGVGLATVLGRRRTS